MRIVLLVCLTGCASSDVLCENARTPIGWTETSALGFSADDVVTLAASRGYEVATVEAVTAANEGTLMSLSDLTIEMVAAGDGAELIEQSELCLSRPTLLRAPGTVRVRSADAALDVTGDCALEAGTLDDDDAVWRCESLEGVVPEWAMSAGDQEQSRVCAGATPSAAPTVSVTLRDAVAAPSVALTVSYGEHGVCQFTSTIERAELTPTF